MPFSILKYTLLPILLVTSYAFWNFYHETNEVEEIGIVKIKDKNLDPMTQLGTTEDCRSAYYNLLSISKSETERIEAIKYSLEGVSSGSCFHCVIVAQRLLQKQDLVAHKEVEQKIIDLFENENICIVYLLPRLINEFGDVRFEQYLEPLFKKTSNEISKRGAWGCSFELVRNHVLLSTLMSNKRAENANHSVIEILATFNSIQGLRYFEECFRAVLSCDPLSVDLIKNLLAQCFRMRGIIKELQKNSIDVLYTDFAKNLIRLNTVKEWNDYKNNQLKLPPLHEYEYSDWDEDGTFDFLQGLLENGFTIEEK